MDIPRDPTDPEGTADTPDGGAFENSWKGPGKHRSDEWLSPTGYVATEAGCLLAAVLLAVGGVCHAATWLLLLPVFDFVALVVLVILITLVITERTPVRIAAVYLPAVACVAYVCGLLFGWYWHTFAVHADLTRAVEATILLAIVAYVTSIVLALLPIRIEQHGLLRLIVGVLLPALLLVTSLVPFYHTLPGFIRTVTAVLITCHLTYEFTAVARRPHRFKFILDLTLAFIIDITVLLVLLLGV